MNHFYTNQYLFSEIYLKEITDFPEKPEITSTLNTLKEYKDYADTDSLTEWKSSFIQKVFGVLSFGYSSVDDNIIKLFRPGETENPISICYALLPNENLDNDTIGSHWSEKIITNLKANDLSWGLLTNGNVWRIYHVDEPSPYETYLQIDLSEILEKGDTKNYMIFFEFMKADNFIKDEEGKCKFDQFKEESFEKIEYIEEELKNALKQREGEKGKGVLNDICMGYIEYIRSKGETNFSNEEFRKEIYSGAMLYMFRLLFIFYATARELLTQEEIDSFKEILKNSKNLFNTPNAKRDSNSLWEELRELFAIIEVHYNGGLFDPEEHKFIENTRISDYFLSRVLYNMNFYKDDYRNEQLISYRDMGVRHLGTLYEGLLEHKLYVAEEDTQVKIEKGVVKFLSKKEGGIITEGNYIPKGEVYFAGDKGERKATGSYYTPEYIVGYIVTNTVGEKLKKLKEEFVKENQSLFDDINSAVDKTEKSRFINYLEEQLLSFTNKKILKLSVLDPAMGSGHFLVNATNKIANFITEFLNEYGLSTEQTSSTVYWRRRVVENCIYGVDINPLAVELAKLSLWILSMAKDAHLSFLNHHLKYGNSLIGARLSDIGIYPGNKKKTKKGELSLWDKDENFKQTVEKVINDYFAIEERETEDKNDIEFKKELLDKITYALSNYKKICDLHTQTVIDVSITENEYFQKINDVNKIKKVDNEYFHWELEYPEIFRNFDGFDCIIKNPPYVRPHNLDSLSKSFYWLNYNTFAAKADLYAVFLERSVSLLTKEGLLGTIISSTWFALDSFKNLRDLLLQNIVKELFYPSARIFRGATVETTILLLQKKSNTIDNTISIKSFETFEEINSISQNTLNSTHQKNFDLSIGVGKSNLANFIEPKYSPLKTFVDFKYGLKTADDKKFISTSSPNSEYKPLLRRSDIERYQTNFNGLYVWYRPDLMRKNKKTARPGDTERFENTKIIVMDIAKKIVAQLDYDKYYVKDALLLFSKVDNKYSLEYILGILNSNFMSNLYSASYLNLSVAKNAILEIPIRNIDFENDNEIRIYNTIVNNVKEIIRANSTSSKNIDATKTLYDEIEELVIYLYNYK